MNKSILIRIANMYYEQNKTQKEIADALGTSRMKISRLLQKCREEGVIEIKINYEDGYVELEDKIKEKYKLKDVIITPYYEGERLKQLLAELAANLLLRILKDGDIVGVGWGSTLTYINQYLNKLSKLDVTFVPLLGGHAQTRLDMNANTIASDLAQSFKGKSYSLLAPAMVENMDLKNALHLDKNTSAILEMEKRANIALIGIGAPFDPNSTLLESGYFTKNDIKELKEYGVECNIISCLYLDKQGKECQMEFIKRIIGISSHNLRKIPLKIGLAGGEGKHFAIKLAIQTGVINIAIIDENTATYLLQE